MIASVWTKQFIHMAMSSIKLLLVLFSQVVFMGTESYRCELRFCRDDPFVLIDHSPNRLSICNDNEEFLFVILSVSNANY